MRACVACALVLAIVAQGCSSSDEPSPGAAGRVDRCTDRLLERADLADASEAEREATRRYGETTYCARFEQRGWIYDDGALSIDAHRWLERGYSCAAGTAEPGGETRTVPCEELDEGPGPRVLDCALLHDVRRSEVRAYVEELRRSGDVECDDGTPLAALGVP